MDSDKTPGEPVVHFFRGENLEADPFRPIRDILLRWSAGDAGALTGGTVPLVENDMRAVALTLGARRLEGLEVFVRWMDDNLDPDCWGSKEAVAAWAARHSVREHT